LLSLAALLLYFLTWKIFIIFQVVVVGRFHSFTLSNSCLTFGNCGGALNMKRHGMLMGKLEFNSYEILMWTLPELHHTPKRFNLKRNRFDY